MTIKLKTKMLKNGALSYRLEYYFGYSKSNKSVKNDRKVKSLNLYTKVGKSKEVKEHNSIIKADAESIFKQEQLKIELKKSSVSSIKASKENIITLYKLYIESKESYLKCDAIKSSFNKLCFFIKLNPSLSKVENLDYSFCEDFYSYMLNSLNENGKSLKVSSVNSYFKKFRQFVSWLFNKNILQSNDAKSVILKHEESTCKDFLTDNELVILINNKDISVYQKAFLFACFTGLRFCDIVKLKYNKIKFDSISGNYYFSITQTKTKHGLKVELSSDASSLIDLELIGQNLLVFPFLAYSDENNKKLNNWLVKNNILNKSVAFHSGRYTMIARLHENGTVINSIAKLVGHKSTRTTERYLNRINTSDNKYIHQLPQLTIRMSA